MITKAIVEEIVSPYEVRIRIPLLDSVQSSSLSTSSNDLNVATICTLPSCYVNLQVGDIVFVGFEDNTYYKAVILGHLCMQDAQGSRIDLKSLTLDVSSTTKLSSDTYIGNVTSDEIARLQGVKENIQKQIDALQVQIDMLTDRFAGG